MLSQFHGISLPVNSLRRYAEFLGTLLFQFFVGFTNNTPLAVGLAYGVLGTQGRRLLHCMCSCTYLAC